MKRKPEKSAVLSVLRAECLTQTLKIWLIYVDRVKSYSPMPPHAEVNMVKNVMFFSKYLNSRVPYEPHYLISVCTHQARS